MIKTTNLNDWWIEKLSKDSEQAVEYLKLSIEEGDLELLRESIDELIKAGYKQYSISSIESVEKINIKFEQAVSV